MIQVQNVDIVMNQLKKYAANIKPTIAMAMSVSLSEAMEYLNNNYKDLEFTHQWFPDSLEFWIYVDGIILCKASGKRIDTGKEKAVGRTRKSSAYSFAANPESDTLFTSDFNLKEVSEIIGNDTAKKIYNGLMQILK